MTNHHEPPINLVTLPRSVVEQTLEVLVDALGGVYCPDEKVVIDALRQSLDAKQLEPDRLTNVHIEQHAHRICTRYGHSSDPLLSHTYTFNRSTLLQFARAIEAGKQP